MPAKAEAVVFHDSAGWAFSLKRKGIACWVRGLKSRADAELLAELCRRRFDK